MNQVTKYRIRAALQPYGSVSTDEANALLAGSKSFLFLKKEIIETRLITEILLVEDGLVELNTRREGKARTVLFLSPGSLFFPQEFAKTEISLRAVTDGRLFVIPKEALRSLKSNDLAEVAVYTSILEYWNAIIIARLNESLLETANQQLVTLKKQSFYPLLGQNSIAAYVGLNPRSLPRLKRKLDMGE